MEKTYKRVSNSIKQQIEHIEWIKQRMYRILNCKFTVRDRGL